MISDDVEEKVLIACFFCERRLRIPITYSGRIRCPTCSKEFLVEGSNELKINFSHYVQLLHDQIYTDFLKIQKDGFNKAFSDDLESGELSFEKFDKFFLSLSQSRRVRSGGVFELIIE